MLINKIKNKHILWKLYIIKALLNSNQNNKFSAINDIIQAANIINTIFSGLNFSLKTNYVKRYEIYLKKLKETNLIDYFLGVLHNEDNKYEMNLEEIRKYWMSENNSKGNEILENVMQVMNNYSNDCLKNLELIVSYIKSITMSDEVYIVDSTDKVIVSTKKN
ncbi:hypothetical protein PL321_10160 [Caloramator sp. mosi_1]|uniref:hypothetical protein n=1 Tax=Caloramator sp. mosi_1 TaxID=3023090 RepID=UPI002362946C|nr:hypothetical protein [Caloramator sp. mosi_1]WDC83183.1 hypothetical protein PL321_10160 [Caloramator sp. mosi_1]